MENSNKNYSNYTIDQLEKGDWFFENLKTVDGTLGRDFDLIGSYLFLTNTKKTGCFSPICAEVNFHLQVIHHEYDSKYVNFSKEHLKNIATKLREVKEDVLQTANCVYMTMEESLLRKDSNPFGYRFGIYDPINIVDVCKSYEEWVDTVTRGMIKHELPKSQLTLRARIYISTVTFKEDWFNKFDPNETVEQDFTVADGSITKRYFLTKNAYYRLKKVDMNSSTFEILIVPYKEMNNEFVQKRFMVYLIPDKHDISPTVLWNNFCEYIKKVGDITNVILGCEIKYVELYIPKIEKLKSKFDTLEMFSNIFKKRNSGSLVTSEMNTYMDIDETGTQASALMMSCFTFSSTPVKHIVKANIPYIAFIYDLKLERILFILNDNGLMESNDN